MKILANPIKSRLCCAAVLASTAIGAQAAVSLVATSTPAFTPDDTGPTSLNAGSYAMTTGNALVVSVAVRHGGGGTGIGATYAAQSPTFTFIEESGDRAGVATFVFINPSITTGDILVDLGTGARAGVVAYELSGALGVASVDSGEFFSESGNSNTTQTVTYDAPAGSYVVSTLSGEGPGTAPSITGDNIDVNPMTHANGDNGRFITAFSSGGAVAAAGAAYETDFAYYQAGAMSSVVIVPEPSVALLGGLGLLGLLRRRRIS